MHTSMYVHVTGGGVDYDAEAYDVTFPIGSTRASLDIIIKNDSLLENNTETFRVSIHSVTNNHTVGIPRSALVIIRDRSSKYLV